MSIKSEILGIAADHGYEGTAQTITGAINALADTLAGEDVAGGRTVASAIHALGPYIGGGGGGGVGDLVPTPMIAMNTPEVGASFDGSTTMNASVVYIGIDGQRIIEQAGNTYTNMNLARVASGLEVGIAAQPGYTLHPYMCVIDGTTDKYTSVEPYDLDIEVVFESSHYTAMFVMPPVPTTDQATSDMAFLIFVPVQGA